MENKPFILTFGSCGWDKVFLKDEDGSQKLLYEEEGKKNSHQAVAAKRAGADSMLVSFVGDDEKGKWCLESLNKCGIDTRFISTVKGESTEGNRLIIDKATKDYSVQRLPSRLADWYSPDMVDQYAEQILSSSFVVLASKQPKDFLSKMINFCYENKIPTTLTASHRKFDIQNAQDLETLRHCTFIAANHQEARDLSGKTDPKDMLKVLPNALITKGAEGVWYCNEHGSVSHENAVPVKEVVDTNGAGDTFIGNFIVLRSEGKPLQQCVRMGMCASALEISKMGAVSSIPFRAETEELYNRQYGAEIASGDCRKKTLAIKSQRQNTAKNISKIENI